MISFVCAYNKKNVLEEMLIKSLKKQNNKNYELITVNSKELGFKSASEALNYGFNNATGEYVVFVHQDIEFINNNSIDLIETYCKALDFGIVGVAGATGKKKFKVASSVVMGEKRVHAGDRLNEIIPCYAIDECMMIVKKDKFKGFNNYGKTWHFYGVEYSHRCLKNNEKVLLLPINIYHASDAKSLDESYFDTLYNYGKINKDVKLIRTCCGYFKNNKFLYVYCVYRKIKLKLKRLFKL